MQKFSYLSIAHADYIDRLLEQYTQDPGSVELSWRALFEGMEMGLTGNVPEGMENLDAPTPENMAAELGVFALIQAYRQKGKYLADIDPLHAPATTHPDLELARFGLQESQRAQHFAAGAWIGKPQATLNEIVARLRELYCGKTAIEIAHIENPTERQWLESKVEGGALTQAPDAETKKWILGRLADAEGFEKFLHTRYVAQKRFSVEGGESVLPLMDSLLEEGAKLGMREAVVGMAHRGRLNLLVNLFAKKVEHIFTQYEGHYPIDPQGGEGDVKYHMGFSHDRKLRSGESVHLSMANNPSHLEFVNAVVSGMARAKQDSRGDQTRKTVVPVEIHGDAAFAGQGVNYETLNFELLSGYSTGGTIHIVINNQVGFTTSAQDARSTRYCTDLAKALDCPVIHVNGDDPEAVWRVGQLAIEFRQKFGKDFFIDLVCYRRHGHNEGDEPSYTQPLMYKKIKAHPTTREIYAARLGQENVLSAEQAAEQVNVRTQQMIQAQQITRKENPAPFISSFEGVWKGLRKASSQDLLAPIKTQVEAQKLRTYALLLNTVPAGFQVHPKLVKFLESRISAVQQGSGIDWGNGEALAYASLLDEGFTVRLSGQDAERGTFTHRHAVLNDFATGQRFTPLTALAQKGARFDVFNSHLSETGVMGFEFGYASSQPKALVIWEAQFGDFANGAQVIIDQFIASSESKWRRSNGLVLLLPHGYEGQGPEHSSCRIERFLQLCGRENISVCNPTTPAQIFHVLRRQVLRPFRKPLVIPSPKSLLRHPMAVSQIEDFSDRGFQEVLGDDSIAASAVKRVLLCSGKIYYELLQKRTALKRADVAIVRLEQLYPMPATALQKTLAPYSSAQEIFWVQEEPRNMGAWTHVHGYWTGALCDNDADSLQTLAAGRKLQYVGRAIAAAPAVGSHHVHEEEQHALVEKAFS